METATCCRCLYTSPSYSDRAYALISPARLPRVRTTHLYDRRVLLAPLHELVKGQLSVLVPVHVPEYFVDALHARTRVQCSFMMRTVRRSLTFSGVSSSTGSFTICPVIL